MTGTPTPSPGPPPGPGASAVPQLEIVIPVYNEARELAPSVTALRNFLDTSFPLSTVITVVDNASTDDTWAIASLLADQMSGVRALHLDQKGRGRALRAAWSVSESPVVAYMDVDLATGLEALLPLVAPLLTSHSDLAIGTRLAPGAHVVRGARREVISRGYNILVRTLLGNSCTDAQCGFKAMRRDAAAVVLPLVEDEAWFFDTELVVTARRLGLRIHEVPVDWVDDLDSRVAVARTAWLDLCGVARMVGPSSRKRASQARRQLAALSAQSAAAAAAAAPQGRATAAATQGRDPVPAPAVGTGDVFADDLIRFAGVGVVSTIAYVALFATLERWVGAYAANALAIVACGIGNTAAHRGMTGAARYGLDRVHRILVASALLGVSLSFTTAALLVARTLEIDSLAPELVAVTIANLAAAAFRFTILRTWIFRPQFGTHLNPVADAIESGVASPSTVPSA
ncbi:MAG: glycosyltransferase, partial [Acidimicrobiales bacterium]